MKLEYLVTMANDIAAFFDAEADKQHAAEQAASHLRRYWEKRMRSAIIAHARSGGAGLSPLALSAVGQLAG